MLKYEAFVLWKTPMLQRVKMNVDGSVRKRSGVSVADGVLRNEKTDWIFGFIYRE
ncbi:hypothetical protein REPUB_Repub08aG0228000 [Reevesia pubescens]